MHGKITKGYNQNPISETKTAENIANQAYSTDWKKLPIGSANIEEVATLPFYADKTSYIAN